MGAVLLACSATIEQVGRGIGICTSGGWGWGGGGGAVVLLASSATAKVSRTNSSKDGVMITGN